MAWVFRRPTDTNLKRQGTLSSAMMLLYMPLIITPAAASAAAHGVDPGVMPIVSPSCVCRVAGVDPGVILGSTIAVPSPGTARAVVAGPYVGIIVQSFSFTPGVLTDRAIAVSPVYNNHTWVNTFETGGPGFVPNDIVMTRRMDFDSSGTRFLMWEIIGIVHSIGVDAQGKEFANIIIVNGEDFMDDIADDIIGQNLEWVLIGNTVDASRANLIYLTPDEEDSPYIDLREGIMQWTDWGAFSKLKVRLGNLNGLTHPVFGPMSGHGMYGENLYLSGKMILDSGSSISWAGVTNKPSIPVVPDYITSTKITAVEIDSPTIIGNDGYFLNTLTVGNNTNFGIIRSYGKTGIGSGQGNGFYLKGKSTGGADFEFRNSDDDFFGLYSGKLLFGGDIYLENSVGENIWLYRHTNVVMLNFADESAGAGNYGRIYLGNATQLQNDRFMIGGNVVTNIFRDLNYSTTMELLSVHYGSSAPEYGLRVYLNRIEVASVYIGGNKVVGAQGSAVGDASGTLASATSQLNALLAQLRTHGLIST